DRLPLRKLILRRAQNQRKICLPEAQKLHIDDRDRHLVPKTDAVWCCRGELYFYGTQIQVGERGAVFCPRLCHQWQEVRPVDDMFNAHIPIHSSPLRKEPVLCKKGRWHIPL